MTTTREAIDRIIEATGLPSATVTYAARYLADTPESLWPKGGRGGGKNAAHVNVRHLTNLLLAIYGGDQIKDAIETTRTLSRLRLVRDIESLTVRDVRPRSGLGALGLPSAATVYDDRIKDIAPDGRVKGLPGLLDDGSISTGRHEMAGVLSVVPMLWALGTQGFSSLECVRVRRDVPEIEVVFQIRSTTKGEDGRDQEVTRRQTFTYALDAEAAAPVARAKSTIELPPELFLVVKSIHEETEATSKDTDLFSEDDGEQPGAAVETMPQTEKGQSAPTDRPESDTPNTVRPASSVPVSTHEDMSDERENQSDSISESVVGRRVALSPTPRPRRHSDVRHDSSAYPVARTG